MEIETLLSKELSLPYERKQQWQCYLNYRKAVYQEILSSHSHVNLLSELNWMLRSQMPSGESLGIRVRSGDICYFDFGQAFLYETGYQHFGIIMSICHYKALVVPMTSNRGQYQSAYDPFENPNGKIHLMRFGKVGSMNKDSVLFLNDMKYLNTARVIDIKGHLDIHSPLFHKIQQRLMKVMFMKEL